MLRIKTRDAWKHLVGLPIVMTIIWVCTLIFPEDFKIADFGSLIVTGALYCILVAVALLIVFLIFASVVRMPVAVAISAMCSFIVGAPILLLFNELVNGFWISDFAIALLISILCSVAVICYEYVVVRKQ